MKLIEDERTDDDREKPLLQGLSCAQAVLNIVNSIFCGGISIVALPLAVQLCGTFAYVILTSLVALVCGYTADLVVIAAVKVHATTYSEMIKFTLGKAWSWAVDLFVFVFYLGASVTFMQAFASVLPVNVPGGVRFWLVLVGVADLIVLLLIKRLEQLAPLSLASMFPMICFGGLLLHNLLHAAVPPSAPAPAISVRPESVKDVLRALAILVFAFAWHPNAMPIYVDLEEPKRPSWIPAVIGSMTFSLATCIFFGLLGAFEHPHTEGNILVDFGGTSLGVHLGFFISIAMVASIPLLGWESSRSLCNMVMVSGLCDGTDLGADEQPESRAGHAGSKSSSNEHAIKLGYCVFVALCTGIALVVGDLAKVISLTGAVCGVPCVFIFPAAAYLAVSREESKIQQCLALLVLIAGVALCVLCTYTVLVT